MPASAFETIVHYKIHGEPTDLFGDGMAIWLTKDKYLPGDAFGNSRTFNGLGVFIDTYPNAAQNVSFFFLLLPFVMRSLRC